MDVAELGLTESEMRILRCLYQSAGKVVSVNDLLAAAFSKGKHKTCSVHICRLRKKLDAEGWPVEIHTAHGQGYRWMWCCAPLPVSWPMWAPA